MLSFKSQDPTYVHHWAHGAWKKGTGQGSSGSGTSIFFQCLGLVGLYKLSPAYVHARLNPAFNLSESGGPLVWSIDTVSIWPLKLVHCIHMFPQVCPLYPYVPSSLSTVSICPLKHLDTVVFLVVLAELGIKPRTLLHVKQEP